MKGDLKKGVTHMSTTSKVSKILSLTLLLGINVISNSYSSEPLEYLRDLFNNSGNTVNFDDSTIMVDNENKTNDIKPEEFIIDSGNNTTYIDMNTLPIQSSIGGGSSISKYNW